MKHIYLFSGLGADERVFKYIKLDDSKLHHIYWEKPIENESLQEYARRIAQKITTKDNYAIGLSFGGVMA